MASLARCAAIVSAFVRTLSQSLVCVGAATGLLYLLRPYVSGLGIGSLGDALPLDELPNRASISIPAFAAVWVTVAVSVALLAPDRRTRRQVIAFAAAVWLCEVAGTTVSLRVVRQESVLPSLVAAFTTAAVYAAAVLSGLAAALGRSLKTRAASRDEHARLHTQPHWTSRG